MPTLTLANTARVNAILDKLIRVHGGEIWTYRDLIEHRLQNGWRLEVMNVVDDAANRKAERDIERMRKSHGGWGPPVNECHPDRIKFEAAKAALKTGYRKDEYVLTDGDVCLMLEKMVFEYYRGRV